MKYLSFLFLITLAASCMMPAEKDRMIAERDSLEYELQNRDETVGGFFKAFNEIQDNLNTIKEKEQIINITASGTHLEQGAKDQINEDIITIYKLLLKNKNDLIVLKKEMRDKNVNIAGFSETIDKLTKEIEQKDKEIEALKQELSARYLDIDNLNRQIGDLQINIDSLAISNSKKSEELDKNITALNTAYFVYGTTKELKEHQVITKAGGFIGIGGIEKLMEDFNKSYFTKIDIRNKSIIPLYADKAKLITTHPVGSYEIKGEKKADSLVIKNPKEFWSVSKYLVIVVD